MSRNKKDPHRVSLLVEYDDCALGDIHNNPNSPKSNGKVLTVSLYIKRKISTFVV